MDTRPAQQRPCFGSHCRDFARWLFYTALVTASLAAAGLYFVHVRLDEEIRVYIESKFRSHYPKLDVTVHSGDRVRASRRAECQSRPSRTS